MFNFWIDPTLRNEREEALADQKKLIDEWMSDHRTEDEIRLKISQLRETQLQLERQEDYDAAADIDQNISELNEKCQNYKYQHPLRDSRVSCLFSIGDINWP